MRLLILSGGFIAGGCSNAKQVNCRELFEKSYEVNINAFVAITPATEPDVARRKAECALNRAYEIDSTFVLKSGKELEDFLNQNMAAIREACDSIN